MNANTPPPKPSLSVCFCVYNEEENIRKCLEDALRNIPVTPEVGEAFEILVIDNASSDKTPQVVDGYSERDSRIRLIRHPANLLYSGSHRTAFREAIGSRVAIIDGDFQHTCGDLTYFVRLIDEMGCDVVYGWKRERKDSLMRRLFSMGLRFLSRRMLKHKLHDINCGYRMFRRDVLDRIRINEKINSVGPEIFCECRRLNLQIGEVLVRHYRRESGSGVFDGFIPLLRNSVVFYVYLKRLKVRYKPKAVPSIVTMPGM